MVLRYYFKRKSLWFWAWSITYSFISIYAYHSRPDVTKDERSYLIFVEEGTNEIASILATSIHFIHPMVLFYWFEIFGQTPIYFLNLPIFLLSCRYFLKSTQLNSELFLIALLPTAFYAGTYLREPFLYSLILILIGSLLRNRMLIALLPSTILIGYRFYWAIISFVSLLFFGTRKSTLILVVTYVAIFSTLFSEFALYSINIARTINVNMTDIIRAIISPLPAIKYAGDVNLYENALLHTMIFPLKLIALFIFLTSCMRATRSPKKWSKDQKMIFTMGLLLLASAILTSLVGPRQVILGQALFILSMTGKYNFRWRS